MIFIAKQLQLTLQQWLLHGEEDVQAWAPVFEEIGHACTPCLLAGDEGVGTLYALTAFLTDFKSFDRAVAIQFVLEHPSTQLTDELYSHCYALSEETRQQVSRRIREAISYAHHLFRWKECAGAEWEGPFLMLEDTLMDIDPASFSERLVLPNRVRKVEPRGFYSCTALREVELPETLECCPSFAFSHLDQLTRIEVRPGGVSAFSSVGGGLYDCSTTRFLVCPRAKRGSYTLAPSTQVVAAEAFSCCEHLQEVVFPQGLISIEDYALFGSGIHCVTLPASLKRIGVRAFGNCKQLEVVTFLGDGNDITFDEDCFEEGAQLLIRAPEKSAGHILAAEMGFEFEAI